MLLRPADSSGDVLPVFSLSGMLSGPEAVAQLVRTRLFLLTGEWWENPSIGFPVMEQLQSSRLTEADAPAFSSMITAYIRETPGVTDVTDVKTSVSGRRFSCACTVQSGEGTATVFYEEDF